MRRILPIVLFLVSLTTASLYSQSTAPTVVPKARLQKAKHTAYYYRHHRRRSVRKSHHSTTLDSTVARSVVPKNPRNYPPPGSGGEDRNYDWYIKRAFPNEFIDPGAYEAAVEQAKKLPVFHSPGKFGTQASMTWKQLGPYKIGGRVTAIATHPTDSNTFYVGAAAGGLWKTTDHGVTWRGLTDNFAAISVGCITIDPHDANTIYLGMGECNASADSYPGNGLWRSTDAGSSWTLLGLTATQYISKVIVDPADRNTIWVCVPGPSNSADSNRGIWKSTDFGTNWTRSLLVRAGKVITATPVPAIDLVMNPSNRGDLVAAMWQKVTSAGSSVNVPYNGLWRTKDSGATWNRIDTISGSGYINGITFKRLCRTSLLWQLNCQDSSEPVLYAVTSKVDKDPLTGYALAENFCALLATGDPEHGWKPLLDSSYRIPFLGNNIDSVDLFNRQGGYDNLIVGHPGRCNEILIGGIDVIRSSDGGATWTDITDAYPHYFNNDRTQHSDMHALAFTAAASGADLLNGQDGGVFNTHDFGASWSRIDGLPITMFYHLEPWAAGMSQIPDPFPVDSLKLFGGSQDNGTEAHGFSANPDWDWINRGDGGQAQADPNNRDHIITSLQLGKIFFRTTLDSLRPNLFSDAGNHDPNAKKWIDLSVIARRRGIADSSYACAFIPPVVLDKANGIDLYTGRTSVYKMTLSFTDPDSSTVIRVWSPQLEGLPNNPKAWYYGDIEALALGVRDPNSRPMLWAAGIQNGGRAVWRTTVNPSLAQDSMPKWIRADAAGLPGLSPSWIQPDRSDSLAAFCAFSGFSASGHLFKTSDGGKTWKNVSGNLPNAPIDAFVIDSLVEGNDTLKKNQCIVVAMDIGVFITTDGGSSWSQLGVGMPNVVVGSLTMYRNWVIAGTHGRSAWAIDVSGITAAERGVRDRQAIVNNLQILSVYPNPAQSTVRIMLGGNSVGEISLELYDIKGNLALRSRTNEIVTELPLPASITTGSYILRATNANGESAEAKVQVVR